MKSRPVSSSPHSLKPAALAAMLAGLALPAVAASDLVISQVYGGGGNSGSVYSNDFIELFNRGQAPISLGGKSVQYASAGGGTWAVTPLPERTLQPGQFFLVQQAAGADTSKPLPPADASGSLTMSGSAGKVALANGSAPLSGVNPVDGVLDKLGYGSNASGFEGAPTAALTNGTAARRIDACIDTDQNSADFETASPTPRNSAAPAGACGGPVAAPIVPSCPASFSTQQGVAGSVALTATDADSIVGAVAIGSGAVAGIALADVNPARRVGGTASATLTVAGTLASGLYPVVISFGNDAGQSATCAITVSVAGLQSIPRIQGAGATSPYAETVQSTEGVVTHKVGSGYFLQDAAGDGDPATSDGIFVFTGTAPLVNVGERLRITGTVTEYRPGGATRSYTEFKDVSATRVLASGQSVTPTNVAFDGRLDHLEGMLVSFTNPLTVNDTAYLGERGELTLSNGRREIPTNRHAPGSAEARALAAANAANAITLDDGIFVTPASVPYLGADGTVRAGDLVTGLTGVIDYGALGGGGAGFKLQPTAPPQFSRTNARPAAPALAGALRVASANVLNFFTTFTNGGDAWGASGKGCTVGASTRASNCRGADNMEEFVRQRDKIVASLKALDADALGLVEIQNNGDIAAAYLAEALNAAYGKPVYAVVPTVGATGTDAIRVAMLYKPAVLSLVGAALTDPDPLNNRAPLAQTFKAANGARFSLVVNHLKSKGGCGGGPDADQGDGQGCNNASRVAQAERLATHFIPRVIEQAGDPDVLVMGDLNAYAFEDPIALLERAAGMVNQLERFVRPRAMPYSYVFGGQSGYLDHALASASLSSQVADAATWHNNADEPTVIDYDLNGKNDAARALYQPDAYRAADHDPVVVSLNLAPTWSDVSASVGVARSGLVANRVSGTYSGTITLSNRSGAALQGPLHLRFDGLPAGVSLQGVSGTHAGAPYLTLSTTGIAPGAQVVVPVVFSNPARAVIGYTSSVIQGAL